MSGHSGRLQKKKPLTAKTVALGGMLAALCIALSAVEGLLTGWLGLPPGVKPGFANVAVMYALFFLGTKPALLLVALKALFAALTRGASAGILSAAGGMLSLAVLLFLRCIPRLGWAVLSVCGAFAHNLGQLAAVGLLFDTSSVVWYLPILTLSAAACGVLSGYLLSRIAPVVNRWYHPSGYLIEN